MSRSGILEELRNEEKELRTQLAAIQRAIEAIEGVESATSGSGGKKTRPARRRRKRVMSPEQREAVSERMRKYWAARREGQAQAVQNDEGA